MYVSASLSRNVKLLVPDFFAKGLIDWCMYVVHALNTNSHLLTWLAVKALLQKV